MLSSGWPPKYRPLSCSTAATVCPWTRSASGLGSRAPWQRNTWSKPWFNFASASKAPSKDAVSHRNRISFNHQISEEAAEWFVEFRTEEPDAQQRRSFDAWVRRSPDHLRAYIELAALWHDAAAVPAARTLDTETLIARARADTTVVAISPGSCRAGNEPALSEPVAQSARPLGGVRRWSVAAAVLVGLFVAAAPLTLMRLQDRPTYATEVGEQRSIRLTDGSTVVLNARSRLRVDFTRDQRTVELLEGQAFFQVSKHLDRPF